MRITALTSTGQQTRDIQRPRLFLSVMAWELRRFRASRLFWLQALGFFCLVLFLTWATRMPNQFSYGNSNQEVSVFVAGTSAWGLLTNLPLALVLLGLLLPFVTTDGVTRDLTRRTHELLLTTTLPTWAYVWGRYLACLLLALGLAVLSLAALLGMGWLLYLTIPAYPLPQIGAVLLLWVGMVVPATVVLSNLSFALGTLLPRQTTLVKVVMLLGWIMGAVILPIGLRDATPPAWYVNWDPTSAVTALGIAHQYIGNFPPNQFQSGAQLQQLLLSVENKMPDLGAWFSSHLLLAGGSLVLVVITALAFRRSRETLSY